jgi:hypothetical protein
MFPSGASILDILDPSSKQRKEATDSTQNVPEENDVIDASEEVAAFHDVLFAPTEQSLSMRAKALVAKGDGKGAETLLEKVSTCLTFQISC